MRESYGMHALDLSELGLFHGDLDGEERCHIFRLVKRETTATSD